MTEFFDALKCVIVLVVVLVAWFYKSPPTRIKYKRPKARVLDGFTVLVEGDTSALGMTPGVYQKEHIGYKKWIFHIRTTHNHPEWHDEAESVADYINNRENYLGM